jgi:hypothetical protein
LSAGRKVRAKEADRKALVTAIPGESGCPQLRYTFDVANQKKIKCLRSAGRADVPHLGSPPRRASQARPFLPRRRIISWVTELDIGERSDTP